MSAARIQALRELIERDPKDATARLMLANDLYQGGDYQETVAELEVYIKLQQDEGAAYRLLGNALVELGRRKDARWAFRHGAEAARAHNQLGMADELEDRARELEKNPRK